MPVNIRRHDDINPSPRDKVHDELQHPPCSVTSFNTLHDMRIPHSYLRDGSTSPSSKPASFHELGLIISLAEDARLKLKAFIQYHNNVWIYGNILLSMPCHFQYHFDMGLVYPQQVSPTLLSGLNEGAPSTFYRQCVHMVIRTPSLVPTLC